MTTEPEPDTENRHEGMKLSRRRALGLLAGAGVIGLTASGQAATDADTVASVGGGSMADAIQEFQVRQYQMTWAEFQDVDAGVEGRIITIQDPASDHHGEVYVDDGESLSLADRQYGEMGADVVRTDRQINSTTVVRSGDDLQSKYNNLSVGEALEILDPIDVDSTVEFDTQDTIIISHRPIRPTGDFTAVKVTAGIKVIETGAASEPFVEDTNDNTSSSTSHGVVWQSTFETRGKVTANLFAGHGHFLKQESGNDLNYTHAKLRANANDGDGIRLENVTGNPTNINAIDLYAEGRNNGAVGVNHIDGRGSRLYYIAENNTSEGIIHAGGKDELVVVREEANGAVSQLNADNTPIFGQFLTGDPTVGGSSQVMASGLLATSKNPGADRVEYDTVTIAGPSASTDNTTDTLNNNRKTINFNQTFDNTPHVVVTGDNQANPGIRFAYADVTTSDFILESINHSTIDRSGRNYDVSYIAIGK